MKELPKLLQPGMEIKRWLLLGLLGMVLASLGIVYIFVHIYRVQPFPEVAGVLTLQFIERPIRGAMFVVLGLLTIAVAMLKLSQSLLRPFMHPSTGSVVDTIYNYRSRQRGARTVVIGGGTGLSVALRGLKEHTSNLTAIVTVADDGGSSGRLRRELGVLPPGDFRNCLVALADAPPLMEKLFQYRFDHGSALDGHSFGNLFIVAMSEVTGNFERAIHESSRVLAVRGQVLPSTISNVTLCAELEDDATVHGESNISASSHRIRRVYLQPERPPAYPDALRAIADADLIVVGPGSLYTSVLPNLLVDGMCEALRASRALKIYVCNVATQPGETDGYGIADHLGALLRHLPNQENLFHFVLANSHTGLPMPPSGRVAPVGPNGHAGSMAGSTIVLSDVVDEHNPVRHDSVKLAETLMRLYSERGASPAQPSRPLQPV
jgi:uncharacterized cofD-like protein